PYHKNEMKALLQNKQANITTRNFPDTVESIRKKWKIKEGGNQYCFFTTDENNNKIVLICRKI
ncbi:MAG: class I SAM-dependent methyltransferase, partial [Flavobacteriaceae bacterium]|nr:class I SAM-dependent methyltransferase [Flavobacteriaceae bacterium]